MGVTPESIKQLIWGVSYNLIYTLLASQCSILLRTCSLPPQHTLGFIFIGQFTTTIIFFPTAWRKWSLHTKEEWSAYIIAAILKGVNLILWRIGSQNMPLGDYAAIDATGVLFAPIVVAVIGRKCVKIIDIFGVVIAAVGIILLTKPSFILPSEQPEIANSIGYLCAAYGGFATMVLPFVLGHFNYVHWTNFLCVGVSCTGVISALYLTVAGWDLPTPPSNPSSIASTPSSLSSSSLVSLFTSSSPSSSSAMSSTSIIAATLVGLITTVYRICQIFACNELESLGIGMAGLLGNVFNAGIIPFTSLLALAFFSEELGEIEAIGASLLFFAIVIITVAKFRISAKEKAAAATNDPESSSDKFSDQISRKTSHCAGRENHKAIGKTGDGSSSPSYVVRFSRSNDGEKQKLLPQ